PTRPSSPTCAGLVRTSAAAGSWTCSWARSDGMTEADWHASSKSGEMLRFLAGKASDRKMRLFACAGCRRIWHLVLDERSRNAVRAAERFADGEIDVPTLESANAAAHPVVTIVSDPAFWPGEAALCASAPHPVMTFMEYVNRAIADAKAEYHSAT